VQRTATSAVQIRRTFDPVEHQTNAIWAAAGLIGKELYEHVSSVALKLYTTAAADAESRGLIVADTKFEFGLVPSSSPPSSTTGARFTLEDGRPAEVILVDEVLTPDSSRFWPKERYESGGPQASFDKQYLRDWLTASGFKKGLEKGLEGDGGWTITEDVVQGTEARYKEAWTRLSS
jgi:phosphoribosylaminoimidazole-succinocarboxamide synthase